MPVNPPNSQSSGPVRMKTGIAIGNNTSLSYTQFARKSFATPVSTGKQVQTSNPSARPTTGGKSLTAIHKAIKKTMTSKQRHRKMTSSIKAAQKQVCMNLKMAHIKRLIKHCMGELNVSLRWRPQAVEAFRDGIEWKALRLSHQTNLCALHAKRTTSMPHDSELAGTISGQTKSNMP